MASKRCRAQKEDVPRPNMEAFDAVLPAPPPPCSFTKSMGIGPTAGHEAIRPSVMKRPCIPPTPQPGRGGGENTKGDGGGLGAEMRASSPSQDSTFKHVQRQCLGNRTKPTQDGRAWIKQPKPAVVIVCGFASLAFSYTSCIVLFRTRDQWECYLAKTK